MQLPPCGLYRTSAALGSIPAGRLVYFHNHGDPGPGLYLPSGWKHNRVELQARGQTLSDPAWLHELEPLPPEGLYRVTEAFHCCERKCRAFEPELLVELGYNAEGKAILFQPELVSGMLAIPTTGIAIDHAKLAHLKQLKVPQAARASAMH
ncbi:MAG TPA: hypothetical protein VGI70_16030 [Polyangiales bacterium]